MDILVFPLQAIGHAPETADTLPQWREFTKPLRCRLIKRKNSRTKKSPPAWAFLLAKRKLLLLALVFGFVFFLGAIHFLVVHFAAGMAGSESRSGHHHEASDQSGDERFHRLPL
jgi:hypothetical protein